MKLSEVLNSFPTKNFEGIDMKQIENGCDITLANLMIGIIGINKTIFDVTSGRNGFESKLIKAGES